MSEPIRTQIDNLDSDMTARHIALMDKLDAVLAGLVAPIDYSTALSAQLTQLEDIVAKLVTSNTLLTNILAPLADWAVTTTNINNLAATDAVVQEEHTTALEAMAYMLGTPPAGEDFKAYTLLQHIAARTGGTWESIGTLASPSMGTVLQLLACICDGIQSQIPIDPLDETQQPATCVAHYQSSGLNLFPAVPPVTLNAIIYATWTEPLPDGLEYGTSVLGELDNGILTTTDWSGWSVFVKSEEPQYADDPISPVRFPTNQWRTMSGSGARIFSVSERGSIEVHLCKLNPYAVNEGECIPLLPNSDHDGHQVFTIPPEIPDTYTLSAMDNFYMVDAEWATSNGPYAVATVYSVATLRDTDKVHMYFGYMTTDPAVAITLCNPEPV
jgi:hypothetical protein